MEDEMGGSSGGGISTIDLTKIASAANDRLKEAFSKERKVLFVCGLDERDHFDGVIIRTEALRGIQYEVLSDPAEATEAKIDDFNVIVGLVHNSTNHAAINTAIQLAVGQRKNCLFVRSSDQSPMPQYVLQFRIRCLSWAEFVDLIRA
jgi:hypothetical protein